MWDAFSLQLQGRRHLMCLQCLRDLWLQQADQFLWLPLPSDLYLLTTFPATYWCYDFLTYPAGYNLTLQSITLCPQLPITLSLSCFLTLRTTDLEFHQDFPSPCPFVVLLLRIHHKLLLPSFAAITVTFTSFSTPCELSPLSSLSRGLAICCWEILVLCYVNIPGSSALICSQVDLGILLSLLFSFEPRNCLSLYSPQLHLEWFDFFPLSPETVHFHSGIFNFSFSTKSRALPPWDSQPGSPLLCCLQTAPSFFFPPPSTHIFSVFPPAVTLIFL